MESKGRRVAAHSRPNGNPYFGSPSRSSRGGFRQASRRNPSQRKLPLVRPNRRLPPSAIDQRTPSRWQTPRISASASVHRIIDPRPARNAGATRPIAGYGQDIRSARRHRRWKFVAGRRSFARRRRATDCAGHLWNCSAGYRRIGQNCRPRKRYLRDAYRVPGGYEPRFAGARRRVGVLCPPKHGDDGVHRDRHPRRQNLVRRSRTEFPPRSHQLRPMGRYRRQIVRTRDQSQPPTRQSPFWRKWGWPGGRCLPVDGSARVCAPRRHANRAPSAS